MPAASSLFLGLFPVPEDLAVLADARARPAAQDGAQVRRWVGPARLHVTMAFLGRHVNPPPDVVSAVAGCLQTLAWPARPLEVLFDQVRGFGAGTALAWCAGEGRNPDLHALRHGLAGALAQAGVACDPRFDPHMTMAYLAQRFGSRPVAPVRWRAGSLRLAFSEANRRDYATLTQRVLDSASHPPA